MTIHELNKECEKIESALKENGVRSELYAYKVIKTFPNAVTYFVEVVNGSQFELQIEDIGATHIGQIN